MKAPKLCNALKDRIETYLELIQKVQTSSSPDTVHDFRVASRYLLAIEPLLAHTSETGAWRKKTRHCLKSLTRLRDLHVFSKRFKEDRNLMPEVQRAIDNELARLADIRPEFGAGDFDKQLHHSIHEFCSSHQKHKTLDALVYELWLERWSRLIKRLHEVDYNDPLSIHRLRISFKPFRYTANFLNDAKLVAFPRFDEFKYWQDLMGDINDLDVVTRWLAELDGYEILIGELAEEANELRQSLGEEEATFRSFIENIHKAVTSGLGFMA